MITEFKDLVQSGRKAQKKSFDFDLHYLPD